ncbi:radical SAM protein, partial [Rothia nasimurium]
DIENKLDKTSQLLLDKLIKEEKIKILNLAGVKFYKA